VNLKSNDSTGKTSESNNPYESCLVDQFWFQDRFA
jgi:hypothetical protein